MTQPDHVSRRKAVPELSSAELLRECGARLTDRALWQTFQERFHKQIGTYVLRALWLRHVKANPDLICDLVQDVYLRLLNDRARILRTFRGSSDFSVLALLGRTAMSAVSDHYRSQHAAKRQAEVIPFDGREPLERASTEIEVSSLLSWIDVERLMEADSDRRNAARNVLIFKLHYVDGFTIREISEFPAFALTAGAIEVILKNLRNRLKKRLQ